MNEVLKQMAGYNLWANQLMVNKMRNLPDQLIDKAVISSFNSIRSTVYHSWSAEDIWLQRLMSTPQPVWAESIFKGSFNDACANWMVISIALEHFVTNCTNSELSATLRYIDFQMKEHDTPVYQILMHVFNHATYHRGQLITLLRKVGETEVPRTDFIVYSRSVLNAPL